jgi:hypothetical protein
MMTEKDFVALADALRGTAISDEVLRALLSFMRAQDERFDADAWLEFFFRDTQEIENSDALNGRR